MSDSIDVRSPGEILETIYAVGESWSERRVPGDSLPDLMAGSPSGRTIDPANPPSRDWIEGDEIEITFIQTEAEDQGKYELTSLLATGRAGSFYRSTGQGMGGSSSPPLGAETETETESAGQWVFDYIRANLIRMTFEGGEATHVEADGMAVGVHVELPAPPTPSPAPNEVSDD
jgi:hypothetical protein